MSKMRVSKAIVGGVALFVLAALIGAFQNCSQFGQDVGSSSGGDPIVPLSERPTVSLSASPEVWRVGSSDRVTVEYTTTKATSARGYHVFTGTCAMAQSSGGQQVPWEWASRVGYQSWSDTLSHVPSGSERDDRGCSIRYCVVATNDKGSTEDCKSVQVVANDAPRVNLSITPLRWRIGSGETVNVAYTTSNATAARGYHVFEGTCSTAQTYPNRQEVPWEFGNQVNGNSLSLTLNTTPQSGERDDRGCTITYCVVATNASGSVSSCVPVQVVGAVPKVTFNVSPSVWRFGSGETATVSYTNEGATSSSGYHVFTGTCALAQQYPNGQHVPWEFANQTNGNSWSTTFSALPASGERDDRGCSIKYCVVAQNAAGSTEECRTVSVQ